MRIGFFAHVPTLEVFKVWEFYRQDIEILESLGHEVVPARRWRQLPLNVDLYYVWWWTWAFQPLALGRLLGKPVVITGVLQDKPFSTRPWRERALIAAALRFASRNVFLSRQELALVSQELKVREPRCIPLGIDTGLYCPDGAPREDFVLTVLWMERRNVRRKCAVEIIEAIPAVVSRFPQMRFVIAGEQNNGYPEVQEAVRRLGVEEFVSFPGLISREKKIELLRRCRIYLQPSRYEGFGLAVLEAMSCGAPVITSPAGAVPEVVGDSGVFLPEPTPEAISRAILELWPDEDRRARLGTEGRRRAEELFSLDARKERIRGLLEE